METMKSRVYAFLEHIGMPVSRFEEKCGLSNGYVSSMRKGFGANKLNNVLNAFPELNRDWLLFGEGSMLRTSPPAPFKKITESEVEAVSVDSYTEVPFFDLAASAGLPRGEGSAGWLDTRLVPRQYAGAEFFVVRISGDSMDDGSSRSLCDGDEVVVKFEPVDMANGLPIRTKLFVVDTLEGAVVKQIIELNHSEGYVVLHSFNPLYPDYRVSLSEVRGFYSVQIFTQKRIRF